MKYFMECKFVFLPKEPVKIEHYKNTQLVTRSYYLNTTIVVKSIYIICLCKGQQGQAVVVEYYFKLDSKISET